MRDSIAQPFHKAKRGLELKSLFDELRLKEVRIAAAHYSRDDASAMIVTTKSAIHLGERPSLLPALDS